MPWAGMWLPFQGDCLCINNRLLACQSGGAIRFLTDRLEACPTNHPCAQTNHPAEQKRTRFGNSGQRKIAGTGRADNQFGKRDTVERENRIVGDRSKNAVEGRLPREYFKRIAGVGM